MGKKKETPEKTKKKEGKYLCQRERKGVDGLSDKTLYLTKVFKGKLW